MQSWFYNITGLQLTLIAAIVMSGCMPAEYTKTTVANLDQAEYPPPKVSRKEVLMLPVSDGGFDLAKSANAGKALEGDIADLIAEAGAHRVDRSMQNKLEDEFKRCEVKGRQCFRTTVPDVVLKAELTGVDVSTDFTPAKEKEDKEGKKYTVPAKCRFKGEVKGLVHVYSMNYMELKNIIDFSGSKSVRQETTDSNCPNKSYRINAVKEAVHRAVSGVDWKIKNVFPAEGHIEEYRVIDGEDDGHYLRLSIGAEHGAKPGVAVSIYRQQPDPNGGRKSVIREKVTEGKIVKLKGSPKAGAWVQIKEESEVKKAKIGDIGVLQFNECTWDPRCMFNF